jgi:peroxiredoxin Q/BCP
MAKKAKKLAKKPAAKKAKTKKVTKPKAKPANKKAVKPAKKAAKKPVKKTAAKKPAAKKPAAKKPAAKIAPAAKAAPKAAAPKASAPKAAAPKPAAPVVVTPMPQVGDEAPDFAAVATDGSKKTLSSFRGSKHVVLYFYPKDDTPGCTVEACSFNSSASNFDERSTVVLGVSPDNQASHQKFSDKFNLNGITLISDEDHKICQSYGVWVEKNMYGRTYMGVQRATFLIGKDGRIHAIWPNVKVDGHSEEVLKVIGSLAG